MKKVLLLAVSFCMLNAGYSVYGGLAYTGAAMDYEEGTSAKSVAGFTVGGSMDAGPVKVGAGFTTRAFASEMTADGVDGAITTTIKQNYLELWTAYPYEIGPVVAFGGFMLGMPMGTGTMDYEATEDFATIYEDYYGMEATGSSDLPDAYLAGMDYGLLFGATYPINDAMSVSASYYMGLAGVMETPEGAPDDFDAGKWSSINATFGYSF